MISICFQGKPFNITVIQVYALTRNAEEAEIEHFYEELQVLLKLTPQKRFPFHYRELECKRRKSRNIWNNRQIWPWSTEWIKVTANRVLQENALVIANTLFQQHKTRLYTWTTPDGQYQNQIGYILCSQRWRSSVESAKEDQELTVSQIMNSLLPNSD